MTELDLPALRSQFPALKNGYIFADNAGGSQICLESANRIYDYLLNSNVQLGADYSISTISTKRSVIDGPTEATKLFNAALPDEIVFGASSTLNIDNLALGLEKDIQAGDEFILTLEHEANAGPWKKLAARRGATVKFWRPSPTNSNNPYSVALKVEELVPLITKKTRILAFTACSNILGSIIPVKEVVAAARAAAKENGVRKLEISVDCVAYAPHRLIDVQDWDVDFCVFSWYKVYGPHVSSLYVRMNSLINSITPIVHHFLKVDNKAYKLQPGGPGYEMLYGTTGVIPYLSSLTPSGTLKNAFNAIANHEQTLLKPIFAFLTDLVQYDRGIRIFGSEIVDLSRVPTISFVVVGDRAMKSRDIVKAFDTKGGMGIRFGHFYAYGLLSEIEPKLDPEDGVVRISLVHYNTVGEVERLIAVLREALA